MTENKRYLPLLPPALLGFLEAPVPYVAGVLAAPPLGYALDEGVVVLVVEEDVVLGGEQLPRVRCSVYLLYSCFTCTKVQILTRVFLVQGP